MAEQSSYLRHLPAVLWSDRQDDPGYFLGQALRIFEKVLSGIPDDVQVMHTAERDGQPRPHVHRGIAEQIDGLSDLFDPWKAPVDFLPWLASWVDLRFPALQGELLWDEYQRRKVTAEIATTYRMRGLRAGLNRYLRLYSAGRIQPRVAIDDGARLLVAAPRADRRTDVCALLAAGPQLDAQSEIVTDGIYRPTCLALDAAGGLFVGDTGGPFAGGFVDHRVWQVDAAGRYDVAPSPPGVGPRPVAATLRTAGGGGFRPDKEIAAVAFAPETAARPDTLYVLDRAGSLFAIANPAPDATARPLNLPASGTPVAPVAMCLDRDGSLLVLDRGSTSGTARPAVLVVAPDPLTVTAHPLQQVVEPLSMMVAGDGALLVGDAGKQRPPTPTSPGNLVRVDRANPAQWREAVLLPADPAVNGLVAPSGIAPGADSSHVYVVDIGLRPFSPLGSNAPYIVTVAQPAAVFRVDLPAGPAASPGATVTNVTEPGGLVYPTGMVRQAGRLVICDPGYPVAQGETDSGIRATPFRFEVIIHFRESELPDTNERRAVRRRINGDILAIVDEQKPAHTWRVPRIGS